MTGFASFEGFDGLSKKLQEYAEKLSEGGSVRIGFLEGSTCGKKNDAPAPEIAFINEMGAPAAHIPSRPFFRTMIEKESPRWGDVLAEGLRRSDYNTKKAMGFVGLIVGEQLQESIKKFDTPENADSTFKKKGFNKPLEDSKNMLRSIEYEVQDGERRKVNENA